MIEEKEDLVATIGADPDVLTEIREEDIGFALRLIFVLEDLYQENLDIE